MSDLTELLEGWDDPLGYRNVSEAEEIISMLRIVKDKWKDDAIMLQERVKELEATLKRIAAKRNCFSGINGCGAASTARAALAERKRDE